MSEHFSNLWSTCIVANEIDLRLSAAAATRILKMLADTEYEFPVPSLCEVISSEGSSSGLLALPDIHQFLTSSSVDGVFDAGRVAAKLDEAEFDLDVNVFERSLYDRADIALLSKIEFAMPIRIRELLAGAELLYVEGKFLLKKNGKMYRNISCIAAGKPNP
jgi:hypothetical protein